MAESFLNRVKVEETTKISNISLKNIDWSVKMIMSSDKLANIKEPIALVELDLETANGIETTILELNKVELKSLLDSLEAANKTVNQLRS